MEKEQRHLRVLKPSEAVRKAFQLGKKLLQRLPATDCRPWASISCGNRLAPDALLLEALFSKTVRTSFCVDSGAIMLQSSMYHPDHCTPSMALTRSTRGCTARQKRTVVQFSSRVSLGTRHYTCSAGRQQSADHPLLPPCAHKLRRLLGLCFWKEKSKRQSETSVVPCSTRPCPKTSSICNARFKQFRAARQRADITRGNWWS